MARRLSTTLFYFRSKTRIQSSVQPHPSAVCKALPAFDAERRAAASCFRSPVSCDRATLMLQRDRQTDGRTDTVPLHRSCCAYYARSASKLLYVASYHCRSPPPRIFQVVCENFLLLRWRTRYDLTAINNRPKIWKRPEFVVLQSWRERILLGPAVGAIREVT